MSRTPPVRADGLVLTTERGKGENVRFKRRDTINEKSKNKKER